MVLVNTLTVEAINTALIALQRGQSIVVGGEKPSTTVNNITISNGGGGSGGSGLDFTPQITALDKRVGLLEKAEELLRQENERQNERLEALEGLGITDFYFDDTSRELTIELANGEVFDTEVTSESFSMEVVNGELIIRIGEQVHTVNLPMGSQADWTQIDPDDPSFIKHKIPIWITQGSADDNMSPIDSVTDGSMRSVTSNAVAQAINTSKSGTVIACASQVIDVSRTITYGMNVSVLGAYGYGLFQILLPTPSGYHREYVLSFQGSTLDGQYIRVRLNNIATSWLNTWSADSFRTIGYSARFRETDIVLEPTHGYTHQNGTNLYYESSGGNASSQGKVWNVTITCFVVKD